MPCYSPLRGYRDVFADSVTGKFRLVGFHSRSSEGAAPVGAAAVDVPCGQCIGCRLERSRKWAVRCLQESELHADNCFVTLTYDEKYLPSGGSLVPRDFQLFMKRLRKSLNGRSVRFFGCGEYGDRTSRPHYHACIFGYDFPDKEIWQVREGVPLFTSAALAKLWLFGFSTVGAVTFESAAYVARYVMKKITGKAAAHVQEDGAPGPYTYIDEHGEIFELEPEFVRMSRRPGIGKEWYEKYGSDVYPGDSVIARGHEMKPPRYYDGLYEIDNPVGSYLVKLRRSFKQGLTLEDNSLSRLKVREKVACSKLSQLKRGLDDEN